MSTQAKWISIVLIGGLLFLLAWTSRYEQVEGFAYRDRWSGRMVYLTEDGFKRDPFSQTVSPVRVTQPPDQRVVDEILAYTKKLREVGLTHEEKLICAGKLMEIGVTSEQAFSNLFGTPLKLTRKDVDDLIKATPVLGKGKTK
jgi:hypothetical protein